VAVPCRSTDAATNIRGLLYVDDHAKAIVDDPALGACYNVGGHNEVRDIDVASTIWTWSTKDGGATYERQGKRRDLIAFVATSLATMNAMPLMRRK